MGLQRGARPDLGLDVVVMCEKCPDLMPKTAWTPNGLWPMAHVAPETECDCFLCWDGPFLSHCVASGKPNHYYEGERRAERS